MSDDFENNISQRLEDFRLNPAPQVWERVAAGLPPKKRRRRFAIWWWLLPLAGLLGGGVWLFIYQQKNIAGVNNKNVEGNQFFSSDSSRKTIVIAPADTTVKYVKQKPVNKIELLKDKKTSGVRQTVELKENRKVKYDYNLKKQIIHSNEKEVSPQHLHNITNEYNDKQISLHDDSDGALNIGNDVVLQLVCSDAQLHKSVMMDSFVLIANPTEAIGKKDLPIIREIDTLAITSTGKRKPSLRTSVKRADWSLAFAAGISSLNGGFNNNEKALVANYSSSTYSSQSGNSFINPKAGIGFSAGIVRRQWLNKHWAWQVEMNYQYLSSKQKIGSRNDSLLLSNIYSLNSYLADAYYTRTTSANKTFSNQVHRIQLLPEINYTFNPSAKSPLSLMDGVAIMYNVSNNLLLHDYRSGSYIRSTNLSNKLMLSGVTGLDVFINNRIHTAVFFQYDFTNVGKSEIGSIFHWNQLQIKIGIPLLKYK